ncbi:MAG: hypothetical protein GWP14_03505 [Actinobacteria bacterium]|nr:hypothetical protein [Actinomycetota bacterium]
MPAKQESSAIDPHPNSQSSQALLVFPVADQWFALPLESVRAVLTADLLQPVAGSLDDLAGWLDVQGQEVLVLDMTQTLLPGAHSASPQQIILLRAGASWMGLATTGIPETISVPTDKIQQIFNRSTGSPWAMWTCRADQRTITVLDPDKFVGDLCPVS